MRKGAVPYRRHHSSSHRSLNDLRSEGALSSLLNTRVTPTKKSTFQRPALCACRALSPSRFSIFESARKRPRRSLAESGSERWRRRRQRAASDTDGNPPPAPLPLARSPSAENAIRFKSPGKLSGDGRTLIENVAATDETDGRTDGQTDRGEARWMDGLGGGGGGRRARAMSF